MDKEHLNQIAKALISKNKGILAADESTGTIKKRFDTINLASNLSSRRNYRELLFTTPNINKYISGIILFDETTQQNTIEGMSFVDHLNKLNIIPGVKVDQGLQNLTGSDVEMITTGLDNLESRLIEYKKIGCEFVKWRAVFSIGSNLPTKNCINTNTRLLAKYAIISQKTNLVPIIEPEVLMDGDHSIKDCYITTEQVLTETYKQLNDYGVFLEGTLLKPNMILPGSSNQIKTDPEEIAMKTIAVLKKTVPPIVPGIAFLSGGQTELEATNNLNAINIQANANNLPWELSFSYGRALQSATLKEWSGISANKKSAQTIFLQRATLTSAARQGQYSPSLENTNI